MADIFSILTYDVDKNSGLTMTDTYQDVANVTMAAPTVVNGWYEFGMSITSTFDTTTKSEFYRFSLDGGTSWNEFTHEPSDQTDEEPFVYIFPKQYTSAEAVNFIVQARKEDTAGTMLVPFADAWIKRVN